MRAVVVYESMYGNTHEVASAIASGLGADTTVVSAATVTPETLAGVELLACGAPTHVHRLPSPATRAAAAKAAAKPQEDRQLEPGNPDRGIREWLQALDFEGPAAAAFDTRANGPATFTGRASKGIARRLRRLGATLALPPESFLVDKHDHLLPGEVDRARRWGESLRRAVESAPAAGRS